MVSEGAFSGRGVGEALRLDWSGGVVVKWFGAGVIASSDVGVVLDDGRGVAKGDEVLGVGCDANAPRRLTIRAAVASEDRKGDVIDANGWELDGYRKNPVFLWAHDRSRPPIGKSHRIWVEDGVLYAVIEFASTNFASEIAGLYRGGFMRGVSVGFLPLETEFRQASNGRRGYLYRRQELLEISAVPVPMHADALSDGVPRSLGSVSSSMVESDELLEMRGDLRRLRMSAEVLMD